VKKLVVKSFSAIGFILMVFGAIGVWGEYEPGTPAKLQMACDLIFFSVFLLGVAMFTVFNRLISRLEQRNPVIGSKIK